MRGTLDGVVYVVSRNGIIPAYAGNTWVFIFMPVIGRDHPRVCGEHVSIQEASRSREGSSPRMRGTHRRRDRTRRIQGIIPAYAGNTLQWTDAICWTGDHPRVCGEHRECLAVLAGGLGSSPRMRGTRNINPRRTFRMGIIPAYAGNTFPSSILDNPSRDHPRVCGEHLLDGQPKKTELGSSPRMRGTLSRAVRLLRELGIIPAYAGNTEDLRPV